MARILVYSDHALMRMRERGIYPSDIEAALAAPQKIKPGRRGCINYFGIGRSRFRLRVTVLPDGATIKTVGWADSRKKGSDCP